MLITYFELSNIIYFRYMVLSFRSYWSSSKILKVNLFGISHLQKQIPASEKLNVSKASNNPR